MQTRYAWEKKKKSIEELLCWVNNGYVEDLGGTKLKTHISDLKAGLEHEAKDLDIDDGEVMVEKNLLDNIVCVNDTAQQTGQPTLQATLSDVPEAGNVYYSDTDVDRSNISSYSIADQHATQEGHQANPQGETVEQKGPPNLPVLTSRSMNTHTTVAHPANPLEGLVKKTGQATAPVSLPDIQAGIDDPDYHDQSSPLISSNTIGAQNSTQQTHPSDPLKDTVEQTGQPTTPLIESRAKKMKSPQESQSEQKELFGVAQKSIDKIKDPKQAKISVKKVRSETDYSIQVSN